MNANEYMPSCLDREVSSPERDAFGHRHFADALRSLIESQFNDPPFSIGLLGGWGTGKSTIKALYVNGLEEDQTRTSGGLTRPERIHTTTFNAWRFGGQDAASSSYYCICCALHYLLRNYREPARRV